ncbi:LuxR C-terminal-related transcriptional regulator [Streptomyces sp. NPDC050504]|uniref:LuxR C-terminal-related transcriptional regulator n=1 Tax=Streptomyces sp. NPDC050504 TaxID=3365618 RepID=UPI0037926F0A
MGFGFGHRHGRQLPVERTSFIGRVPELTRLRAMLGEYRLVTLVGPGGIGKTRTALRAATAAKERFSDGVRLAELSALDDPELVPALVAAALELPDQPGMAPLDAIVSHLQGRRQLLVLDTCEHLLDACAVLCDTLLRETADVCVLATSRQPLDVPGERCMQLAPLTGADAEELFAQRAAAVVPHFAVADANREQVRALTARLDGMPLALELAAVRLRAVPLTDLVARLDRRFEVLTGGQRTALTRHQTLRTAIDWSRDLCTPREQLLWSRLSVFAGSFELSAAERVCAGGEDLPPDQILPTLAELVDKSVVLRVGEGGERYQLLDTIREYGAERLAGSDDPSAVRERHLTYYKELGQLFWDRLLTPDQVDLHRTVRVKIANIRAAVHYAYETRGRAAEGLWLAAQLTPHWRAAGTLSEGCFWIEKGLGLVPEMCPERAWGLFMTALAAVWTGDLETAPARFAEAREVALSCGEERVALFTEPYMGAMRALVGEVDEGLAALEAGRRRIVEAGDPLGMAVVHCEGALLRAVFGDLAGALELCAIGIAHLENTGDRQLYASTLLVQGVVLWLAGRHDESAVALRRALEAASEVGDILIAAMSCLVLAWHAAREGRHTTAGWLLGYAESARSLSGDPVSMLPSLLEEQEAVHAQIRDALGDTAFRRLHALGARLSGTRVLEAVHAGTELPQPDGDVPAARRAGATAHTLTPREREVAGLVAQGLSNREVAERLVISKRTADTHIERILNKLGITSRTEIPAALGNEPGA